MPGRTTSGYHQPGRHCLHHARSAVRFPASRIKGELPHFKNARKTDFRHLAPTFLLVDDNANELLCFLVRPPQRQQWVLLFNCLVGALPYSPYMMRSFPLCGVTVHYPAHYDLLDNPQSDRQQPPPKKKRYPGCLAHAEIGMYDSVVAGSPFLQDGPATNSCRTFWHTFVPGTCTDPTQPQP